MSRGGTYSFLDFKITMKKFSFTFDFTTNFKNFIKISSLPNLGGWGGGVK